MREPWQRVLDWHARKSHPIYIDAPPYDPLSGGNRAMHLLCHHLDRAGYDAYVLQWPAAQSQQLPVRYLTATLSARHRRNGREPIVVYPEVVRGNPRGANYVVRYLLNRPGLLAPGAETSFGCGDYFITFAAEHVPTGVKAHDLFMPLVDRTSYYPPTARASREGFALFTHRARIDPASLPPWLSPRTLLSMDSPRSHAGLGELYRRSRALVTWERSSAIYEALACGCPVICIASENFREEAYQPRFRGAGIVWGWHEAALDEAQRRTSRFAAIYGELEHSLHQRIRYAFDAVIRDVRERICTGRAHPVPGHEREQVP